MDVISTMAMGSWAKLNAVIGVFTEKQLNEMLTHERKNGKRLDIMVRLQQRLNALEGARKIDELRKEFTK